MEAWIYPYDVVTNPGGGGRTIVRKGNVYHPVNYSLSLNPYAGEGILSFGVSSDQGAISASQWQHVAGVFDPSDSTFALYVNGRLVGHGTRDFLPPLNDDPVTLGLTLRASGEGIEDMFWGVLDEVRIWRIPRTQEEIQADMHRHLDGTEEGLVAYWQMEEGTGQVAGDCAGGHDGQLGRASDRDVSDPVWVGGAFSRPSPPPCTSPVGKGC